MGNYLEKPVRSKERFFCQGNGLSVVLCAMQGWRASMEDCHYIETSLPGNVRTGFYGVFDGHGGSYTSSYTSEHLLDELLRQQEYHASDTTPQQYEQVLKNGFVHFDQKLKHIITDQSGSTAITSFITPSHIIVGNLGDSRCLLSRGYLPIPMSIDHKPEKESERQRIIHAGGLVAGGRVGDLAVARAFGDFSYKGNNNLEPHEQLVSSRPDVYIEERTSEDNFLILACDGIWDVMPSPAQTIELLKDLFESYEDPKDALSEFLEICLKEGSKDNMTIMIIFLNKPPTPIPEKVALKQKSRAEHPDENEEEVNNF
ncbi:hypothetical protein WA158_001102 [Blastocystis sp. Blastoise]